MSEQNKSNQRSEGLGELYEESHHVNVGGETIHAKRMGGRFRQYKIGRAHV